MSSFWETMKRLVAGQPVFRADEEDGVTRKSDTPAAPAAPARQQPAAPKPSWQKQAPAGPKIIPQVVIDHIECRLKGTDHMEVSVHVRNTALERVLLDKILLLNEWHDIDDHLEPGQMREFTVYYGEMPKDTYASRAELHYRTDSGDYFSAVHHVEFEPEKDGRYSIRRIRFLPPVKDI